MPLRFNPPSFVQPHQFSDLPRGLDQIFEAHMRRRALDKQRQLLDVQIQSAREGLASNKLRERIELGGLDPTKITESDYTAALSPPATGPFATQAPQRRLPQPIGSTGSDMAQPSNLAPAGIPESVNITRLRELFQRRNQSSALESLEKMTGIRRSQAEAARSEAISNSFSGVASGQGDGQFYTDPDTGMKFRIKPGPRGNDLVPLPGQAIGPGGKVVFTADRGNEGKMLPPASVLALNEGKNVARMLPDVEEALQQNSDIFGPARGRLGRANPYDERAQTVDARMRTASQAFGRFMEGGVLRHEDEEKYRKMFPQLSDTSDVARNKLAIVRRQLAQKYEDDRSTLGASGYDVSGFQSLPIPKSLFEAQPASGTTLSSNARAIRIREDFRAGRITREQAHQLLEDLGR